MDNLRDRLISQYTDHYRRINTSIAADSGSARRTATNDLVFGDLLAEVPGDSTVLDLGCGTGIFLSWLSSHPHVRAVGVDQSETQARIAAESLPSCQIHCADGLAFLRENPGAFAAIFCFDVLEHIPGDDLLLEWVETARSALTPGGFFVCRVPNGANLTSGYSRYIDMTHERLFTRVSLLQLLDAGGLERARNIPLKLAHPSGRLRQGVEYALHRAVYLVCGRGRERTFTTNVCAVGYRPGT